MDSIVHIEIQRNSVTAVRVEQSSKATLVTGCGFSECVEKSLHDAIGDAIKQSRFSKGASSVTLSPELFAFRNINVPFSDTKKIDQILPLELEDQSPVAIETLHLDYTITKSETTGANLVVAMINGEVLRDYIQILNSHDVDPEIISISGVQTALALAEMVPGNILLVDITPGCVNLFVIANKQIVLIRVLPLLPPHHNYPERNSDIIVAIKQTLMAARQLEITDEKRPVYLSGFITDQDDFISELSNGLEGVEVHLYSPSSQPLIKIDSTIRANFNPNLMDRSLASALQYKTPGKTFNFRKNQFKKRKSIKEFKRLFLAIALPLILLTGSATIFWGNEYSKLVNQKEELQTQIKAVFKETLPEVRRIVNPTQQLQVANNNLLKAYQPGGDTGTNYTILNILTEISAFIPEKHSIKVVRFVADQDEISLRSETEDFNTVHNVKKALEKSNYFETIDIGSANQSPKTNSVSFELKLKLAR